MSAPYKIFGEHIEEGALRQFHDAMQQDFVVRGALMPDAHRGYSLPIGAVVATRDVVLPSWVGYDIGCGMCALPTTFPAEAVRRMAPGIHGRILKAVPTGFSAHATPQSPPERWERGGWPEITENGFRIFNERGGFSQLGTLGGGNHFIEVGTDESDVVWVIIHSGSRGVGHGIATNYMKLDFGFRTDSDLGREYLTDNRFALLFALENRLRMMELVVSAMQDATRSGEGLWVHLINRNHNHSELVDDLWVHRKGATQAHDGMAGVIPGNMRDGSFIVEGLGNPESLWSSSHGAGRVLGRKQAKRELDVAAFENAMQGIVAQVGEKTLDEAPMAYKDIFVVMAEQAELVKINHYVTPILNVKG